MRFVFLAVILLLLALLGIYLYHLLRRIPAALSKHPEISLPVGKRKRILLICITILLLIPAVSTQTIWLLVLLHFLAFAGIIDLIHFLALRIHPSPWPRTMRRLYLSNLIPLCLSILVIGYGYWNMHHIMETDYSLPVLNELSEDYRIAFLSDLHYGLTMNETTLQTYCDTISSRKPDLVILGGDIVDERTTNAQMKEAFATLATIQSRYGIFYVYGNHDRATYSNHPNYSVEELRSTIEAEGITILCDRSITINQELLLSGRDDRSNTSRLSSDLLSSDSMCTGSEIYHILVDHQPYGVRANAKAGYDLMLSGHTHDGQIWPGGLLASLAAHDNIVYGSASFDGLTTIVSSGIAGWGFPIRTEGHCEYLIIDLIAE